MRGLSLFIVLVALVQWSTGYSYGRPSSYGGSGSYGSGSYSSYGSGSGTYGSGSSGSYGSGSYGSGSSYGGGSYGSSGSYGGNSAYTSSHSSSSSLYSGCCTLNSWGQQYLTEIREFSSRLRQEYTSMSTGTGHGYSSTYHPWSGKRKLRKKTILGMLLIFLLFYRTYYQSYW